MNKISGIYGIRSISHPERVYIGSSLNIRQRWHIHRSGLRQNIHHSLKLQRHYRKYGANDLIFEVIYYCNIEELINIEQSFINLYNPYFNCSSIAGSPLGYRHTKTSKQKMSRRNKGRAVSEETRRRMSEAHKRNPSRARLVINLETGIFYNTIKEAAISTGIKTTTLWHYLHGKHKNKTMLALI